MDELTEIIKSRDKEKLTELLMQRKQSLYKLAKAILNDERYIEDVIQETIITTYFKINDIKNAKSFDSWLKKILVNEALKVLRKNKREILVGDEFLSNICIIDDNLNSIEQKLDFKFRTKKLKEKEIVTLILYFKEKYTMKEIAIILNEKESTIKSRIKRAKDKLKKLQEKGGGIKWEEKKIIMK